MTCDEAVDYIEMVAAGDNAGPDEVARHMASCAACAAALEQARAIERALQAQAVPRPPASFTADTLTRIRRARWRSEQRLDLGFNLLLASVALLIVGGIWLLLDRSGLVALASASNDLMTIGLDGLTTLARRAAPSVPLYLEATALVASALGIWWWAERGDADAGGNW